LAIKLLSRIAAATLLPFESALRGTPLQGHFSPGKEAWRQAVNRWMRDPDHPSRLLPAFDLRDHLHPGDTGYKAMADMLDMATLFSTGSTSRSG